MKTGLFSRFSVGFVLTLSLVALHPFRIAAEETVHQAPFNPAFLEYQAMLVKGAVQSMPANAPALGCVPAPVSFEHTAGQSVLVSHPMLGAPAAYDLRTLGKLTAVRNQGGCGSCWTFGACASLESHLLTGETCDFSENNLKNNAGFDYGPCGGGNIWMSTAYLARWGGPVTETVDPYHDWDDRPSPSVAPVKHVQEVLFLPLRASATDNEMIKQAVMMYGAVTSAFYYDGSCYNGSTYAYYYSGSSSMNHEVAIVGWDDNFPAARFLSAPPGNGAFLMKNSWGTGWGQAGYFYISYYDTRIGMSENAVFENAEPTDNYTRIYQYDPLGWVSGLGYGTTSAWAANVFTAVDLEQLRAVSFYTPVVNSSYQIYIYQNPTSVPVGGTPVSSLSGTIAYPGYHTLALATPVMLSPGQKFSVVVELTTPGYNYPIAIEYAYAGFSSGASAQAGQSYFSSTGTSWQDATTWAATCNVCIKALTTAFHITAISREGNDLRVTWLPAAGNTNALEVAGSACGVFSNNLVNLFIVTNVVGNSTNYLDVGAATNNARFYRVRLKP